MGKKIARFFTTFLILFTIIFSICVIAKVFIDTIIFSQRSINFRYIYIELIIIALSSILLTFFYQINSVKLFIQILVTYIIMLIDIHSFGVISGWFKVTNIKFAVITLIFNVLGLVIASMLLFIKYTHQQNEINKNLMKYKEDNKDEEN